MSIVAKWSPISATAELLFVYLTCTWHPCWQWNFMKTSPGYHAAPIGLIAGSVLSIQYESDRQTLYTAL